MVSWAACASLCAVFMSWRIAVSSFIFGVSSWSSERAALTSWAAVRAMSRQAPSAAAASYSLWSLTPSSAFWFRFLVYSLAWEAFSSACFLISAARASACSRAFCSCSASAIVRLASSIFSTLAASSIMSSSRFSTCSVRTSMRSLVAAIFLRCSLAASLAISSMRE